MSLLASRWNQLEITQKNILRQLEELQKRIDVVSKELSTKESIPNINNNINNTPNTQSPPLNTPTDTNNTNHTNYTKQVIIAQSAVRRWIARKQLNKLSKSHKTRSNIILEIVSSENTYNESLHTVIEVFLLPLKNIVNSSLNQLGFGVVSQSDIFTIFSHFETICVLSDQFLHNLNKRLESGKKIISASRLEGDKVISEISPDLTIGDIFVHFGPFMKSFKQFYENYDNSIAKIAFLKTYPAFNQWLYKCERDPRTHLLDLPSLLILPIQRIPRYILLLQALLCATPSDHPDMNHIMKALSLIKDVANLVNQGVKENQGRKRLLEVQSKIDQQSLFLGTSRFNLIQPHRLLLKEGALSKRSFTDGSLQKRHIYLCNDLLITVTILFGKQVLQKVDKIIPLINATVINNDRDERKKTPRNEKVFQRREDKDVSFFLASPVKTHLFVAESKQEKDTWIREIQNAIADWLMISPSHIEKREKWQLIKEDGIWKVTLKPDESEEIEDFVYLDKVDEGSSSNYEPITTPQQQNAPVIQTKKRSSSLISSSRRLLHSLIL